MKNNHSISHEARLLIYIDIRGFKNFSHTISKNTALRKVVFDALSAIKTFSNNISPLPQNYMLLPFKQMDKKTREVLSDCQATFFSDHIVVSRPIRSGLTPCNWTLQAISHLVNALHCHGFLVRGCITVGKLTHKDGIVFGEALVEANEIENSVAINPCIVITPKAMNFFMRKGPNSHERNMLADPSLAKILHIHAKRVIHHDMLRKDSDDLLYLNTLFCWWWNKDSSLLPAALASIKHKVIDELKRHKHNERILNKWIWFNEHFNRELSNQEADAIWDFIWRFDKSMSYVFDEIVEKVLQHLPEDKVHELKRLKEKYINLVD